MMNYQNVKKYPAYKDSGVEWIGEVPVGWHLKRIKYMDIITMGQSPDSKDCNVDGNGMPFLQGNAEFGSINPNPILWSTKPKKQSLTGDILLSVRAPVGEINISNINYCIGRGLCAIKVSKSSLKLRYYQLIAVKHELIKLSTGSTFKAISIHDISNSSINWFIIPIWIKEYLLPIQHLFCMRAL